MPDSKRLPVERDDAATRDSQIDALLEEGLDRYFNNRYEDAIHLWTRVLFVDRTHARARAYIDRARTALAETQRRSEELLQTSRDLIDQGRTDAARELLAEAVAASGDDVQSAALRAQLERRERAQVLATPLPASPTAAAVPGWTWRPTPPLMVAVVAVASLAMLLGGLSWLDAVDSNPSVPPVIRAGARPATPSASEVALIRARALYSRGRLAEALQKVGSPGTELEFAL